MPPQSAPNFLAIQQREWQLDLQNKKSTPIKSSMVVPLRPDQCGPQAFSQLLAGCSIWHRAFCYAGKAAIQIVPCHQLCNHCLSSCCSEAVLQMSVKLSLPVALLCSNVWTESDCTTMKTATHCALDQRDTLAGALHK